MTTLAYPYQSRGIRRISALGGRVLLADEMGLGKTFQALKWFWRRKKTPGLVICPAYLKENWRRECVKHLGIDAGILSGKKPHPLTHPSPLTIVNYDILHDWKEEILKMGPQLVMIDECQFIKSPAAKRTKATVEIAHKAPFVIGMSGTPFVNTPAELWTMLHIINPEMAGSYYQFAHRYSNAQFIRTQRKSYWKFSGGKNLEELHAKLNETCMIRRRKRDVLQDLPDKFRSVVPFELERKNQMEYDKAQRDFLSWLSAKSPAKAWRARVNEKLLKLGYLRRLVAQLKLPLVLSWLEEALGQTDGKIVLFAYHQNVLEAIHKKFPGSVLVYGKTSLKHKQLAIDKFQNNPKTRLFLGSQAALTGINLTAASTVVFAELFWTPAEHDQAESRCDRIGQKNAVGCYYLVAQNTLEEKLCDILQEKNKTSVGALDGGKSESTFSMVDLLVDQIQKGQ